MKSFENPVIHSPQEQTPVPEVSPIDAEISLRTAEHSGDLSPEDFYTLIEDDFQEILSDIPPITYRFDPILQLSQIRTLPKSEQRVAIDDYKDLLINQRKAIALCRSSIERIIKFDYNVSKEKLLEIIRQYAVNYGFSEKQLARFEQMIEIYHKYHHHALNKRAEFTDDRELVKELTGVELNQNADCRIEMGPVSVDIFVDGLSASTIYHKHPDVVANFRHAGFSTFKDGDEQILYNVINTDPVVRKIRNDVDGISTRIHEQEHQKNRLLRIAFNPFLRSLFTEYIDEYKKEQNQEIKREILEELFADEMFNAYAKAADEIIAILSSRPASYLKNKTHALFFAGEIDAYDYLKSKREFADLKNDTLYNEVSKELLVTEYKRVLTRGVVAIISLIEKGGYTNAEATALLTDKTLPEWPQVVRRILAHDKKQTTSQNAL